MKIEIRRELARQPFEQKIRKVAQLIQLAGTVRAQRVAERAEDDYDVGWLKNARKQPMHYRPLSDVLTDLEPRNTIGG